MKIFQKMYDYCLQLSKHPKAMVFMSVNSFIESIFWPIPVDAMIIPMCLAKPKMAIRIASYAVFFSVLGAIVGYFLGYFLWDGCICDIFTKFNWLHYVKEIEQWFTDFGILFVAIGAFTPIPYKVIAISTGMMASSAAVGIWELGSQLSLLPFILVSVLGRGARFYLEAVVIKVGGKAMADKIRKYIDILGWLTVGLVIVFLLVYKLR